MPEPLAVTNYGTKKPTKKGAFRELQDMKQTEFADDYRKANCLSRLLFCYPNRTVKKARENKFQLTDEMIINMNTAKFADGEEESYIEIKQFWKQLERQVELQKSRGRKDHEVDWESVILWAIGRHLAPGLL